MDQSPKPVCYLIKELKPMLLKCQSRLQNILHPLLRLAVLKPFITGVWGASAGRSLTIRPIEWKRWRWRGSCGSRGGASWVGWGSLPPLPPPSLLCHARMHVCMDKLELEAGMAYILQPLKGVLHIQINPLIGWKLQKHPLGYELIRLPTKNH